ncbi:hypothetical protein Droror1_Dr00008870 [Drosera rotundifolia]
MTVAVSSGKAEVCPNGSCGIRIHKYCLVKKYSLAKGFMGCVGVNEKSVMVETVKIVERYNAVCKRKLDFGRVGTEGLVAVGFDASVCKSKLEKSPSFPAEHALTGTTNPNGEAEGIYHTANNGYPGPDQRKFEGLKPIALGIAYLGGLYSFVQVRDIAYDDCYICTMSSAVTFVLSTLIMAGVILNTNAGRHEINFVLIQVHYILLIFAFVSGMPLMFRPIKDKFRMLIVVWFIYFVIVTVTHYQKIISGIIRFLEIRLTEHIDNPTTEVISLKILMLFATEMFYETNILKCVFHFVQNGSYHHVISIPIETMTHTIPNHTAIVMRPLDQNYSNSRTSYIEKKRLDREEVMGENTGIFQAPPMTESTYPKNQLIAIATTESQQTLQVDCQHQSKQPRERRGPKGYPTKPVCQSKINLLWRDVFHCSEKKPKEYVFEKEDSVIDKKDSKFCSITYGHLRSLMPGRWLCDDVIDTYAKLLISRPSTKDSYVLPVHFLNIIKADAKAWLREKAKKHRLLNTERQVTWSYMEWNGQGSIAGKNTIFIPVHVRSNHFVLFVFYVKRWELILLDPMFGHTPSMSHSHSYKEEIAILVRPL